MNVQYAFCIMTVTSQLYTGFDDALVSYSLPLLLSEKCCMTKHMLCFDVLNVVKDSTWLFTPLNSIWVMSI